jgi:hypothetical protein
VSKLLATSFVAILLLGLGSTTGSAAPQCPPGTTYKCLQGSGPPKNIPPPCGCVATGGAGYGGASHGKAEIKKKNVPQVRPNKTPPS